MSFQAKRELLAQVAPRYQHATHTQKSLILDEFIAATGYARKYAIRLLTSLLRHRVRSSARAPGPMDRRCKTPLSPLGLPPTSSVPSAWCPFSRNWCPASNAMVIFS